MLLVRAIHSILKAHISQGSDLSKFTVCDPDGERQLAAADVNKPD